MHKNNLEEKFAEIFENPRTNRSIKLTNEDESPLEISKNSLNDTQTERDMNDILGPLPDIPVSHDISGRLSLRRSSGCSGIYEEILDPTDANVKIEQDSRCSFSSEIYVVMSAPNQIIESAEQPPPLPPRRRTLNHVYTPINSQAEASAKTRKSTWNLKNVFGRTKEPSKNGKTVEISKSQTTAYISKLCATNYEANALANCKNSFSTPDLTNIIGELNKITETPTKGDCEEIDLDIMDIERSNSLNCSSNQFACRPPTLNISDQILWSHNLSVTLSSTANSSAINLVGANINGNDSILGRDISGYCKMAPIINNADKNKMIRTSTTHFEEQLNKANQDSSSVYCEMAPILPKSEFSSISKISIDCPISSTMKNITFERNFDFDDEQPSLSDCSMKSVDNSTHASFGDITSSSGVSSYDGNTVVTRCFTPDTKPNDYHEHDDAISLTFTESPPQSAQSHLNNESPYVFHQSKFDEKTPSYFPNEKSPIVQDTTKYTVNLKSTKQTSNHNRRKPSDPVAIPVNKESNHNVIDHLNHLKNVKKQTCKGLLTPTTGKVQKFNQRRGSIGENGGHFEHHPTAIAYKNENWYCDMKSYKTATYCKYDTLPSSFDSKKVLSHLNANTNHEPNRNASFEKNSKSTKLRSSPRRIYNKCATLAIRLKTPPSTPTNTTPSDQLNSSIDTVMRSNKNYHIPSGSNGSSNSLIRSWARFRKIDFSPLKTKINSIWQRPSNESFN